MYKNNLHKPKSNQLLLQDHGATRNTIMGQYTGLHNIYNSVSQKENSISI